MHKRTPSEIEQCLTEDARPVEYPAEAHHMHHYLHLAAVLGADPEPVAPRVFVSEGEISELEQKFSLPKETPRLAFIPGAEYGPAKRWPGVRFAATAKAIEGRHYTHILLLGGPADQAIAEEIAATLEPGTFTNLTGCTTLRELTVALAASSCVLTNDTGPMHLAAAVDVPVVALFGSTSPELTAPGLPGDSKIQILHAPPPCAPCFLRECPLDARCLNNISVESAVSAIEQTM
jgi:heptosyltransferase-2